MRIWTCFCLSLAAAVPFVTPAVSHDHGSPRGSAAPSAPTAGQPARAQPERRAADDGFVPAYLLAAVCGMPAVEGDPAFERRVQIARLLAARAQESGVNEPPLLQGLGDYRYPITTRSEAAQSYFDQGLRLAHAFNHPEALRAFRWAQRIDPQCAMCYWGEAYVLGPNINAPMDPDAVAPAFAASGKAAQHASGASGREQALIAALQRRYAADAGADRAALDRAYANAMAQVAARFPDDVEIATLYADALMNLAPWDYWEADGRTPRPVVAELVPTLERALARNPRHPYAIHLYIHAVEASTTPERAEPYADRLGGLMTGAGHMVHMPSHIYFRIGRYQDSIVANEDAVAADESYIAQVSPQSAYPYAYYPHNVHFLMESARMVGDGRTALAAAEKLPRIMSDEVTAKVPFVQPIKAAPYFAHAQFSPPETTLRLPDPGDRFPYVRAMWHYARGVAFARQGAVEAARAESEAIEAIQESADFSQLTSGGVPAPDVIRLARHVVAARIAQAEGDLQRAAAEFRSAVAIQDRLPYTEPPYWYYPVRQSLGAVLLQAGQTEDAERAFREALQQHPDNAWTLFGLLQAQQARGDSAGAAATRRQLDVLWEGQPKEVPLSIL